MSEQEADQFGNIWITSRIRMAAHEKFVRFDRISHVLLTVYSVVLLGFSVFQRHLAGSPIGPYSSEISIVLSLSILCASLVIWGLGFGDKARDHRDCYLALQRLYDAQIAENEKKLKYQEILDAHPNHSGLDNERFLFRKLIIEGAEISNASGRVSMGRLRAIRYLVTEFISFLLLATLVLAPLIVIYMIYAFA